MILILLVIAILPVYLIGLSIYKKDKNKEPKKLLKKLFIGGIKSALLTILISLVLSLFFPIFKSEDLNLNIVELFAYVFFAIAIIEEGSKWFFLYRISFHHEEFDEIFDMIVYSVFVSLGFACFENIFYTLEKGVITGIMRALLSVPGHACFGVCMGYFLSQAKIAHINKNDSLKRKNIFYSLIMPALLHTFYDFCLMSEMPFLLLIFIIFVIILFVKTVKNTKKMSLNNYSLIKKDEYCPNCGNKVTSKFCTECGQRII